MVGVVGLVLDRLVGGLGSGEVSRRCRAVPRVRPRDSYPAVRALKTGIRGRTFWAVWPLPDVPLCAAQHTRAARVRCVRSGAVAARDFSQHGACTKCDDEEVVVRSAPLSQRAPAAHLRPMVARRTESVRAVLRACNHHAARCGATVPRRNEYG